MPGALAAGLTARLRDVAAQVGTGTAASPAPALSGIHRSLVDLSSVATQASQRTDWAGQAGDAAAEFTTSTVAAIDAIAGSTQGLGGAAARAAEAVTRARNRLHEIVEEFEARAAALEARLDEPGVAEELI